MPAPKGSRNKLTLGAHFGRRGQTITLRLSSARYDRLLRFLNEGGYDVGVEASEDALIRMVEGMIDHLPEHGSTITFDRTLPAKPIAPMLDAFTDAVAHRIGTGGLVMQYAALYPTLDTSRTFSARLTPLVPHVAIWRTRPDPIPPNRAWRLDQTPPPPDVVVEVVSASAVPRETNDRRAAYAAIGVGEYYLYEPGHTPHWRAPIAEGVRGWHREADTLVAQSPADAGVRSAVLGGVVFAQDGLHLREDRTRST